MRPIEYISYSDATGYGTAAVGYVRALVEAGCPVHWQPFTNDAVCAGRVGPAHAALETERGRAALVGRGATDAGNELAALVAATATPVDPALRIVHLLPSFWSMHRNPDPGVRHVGMTVWETDRITPKWLPELARMEQLWVPCTHNVDVLRSVEPPLPPVWLVPHVCRPVLSPPPAARLKRLRDWAGVRPDDAVFYSIGSWDPRKRLAALLDGFVRAFTAEDRAVLILKTSARALYDDPDCPVRSRSVRQMASAVIERAAARAGRPPPRITLLADDEVADNVIDGLHAIGDCFVSLSRCEGFGLGGFDAAAHGRPVIAVGYGGPIDYLGQDWPGRVPHRMVPADALPGVGWFGDGQQWPEPEDAAAFALMRDFAADRTRFIADARSRSADIQRRFGAQAAARGMAEAMARLS